MTSSGSWRSNNVDIAQEVGVGEYLAERVDKPLEEVGDAEVSSQVLNFVESDGLSRVRVCHVEFTPLILGYPSGLEMVRCSRIEADGGGFAFSRRNIHKKEKKLADLVVVWARGLRTRSLELWIQVWMYFSTSRYLLCTLFTRRATTYLTAGCHWPGKPSSRDHSVTTCRPRMKRSGDCSAQTWRKPSPWVIQIIPLRTPRKTSLCPQEWSLDQTESRVRSARPFGTGDHQARPKPRRP